MRVSFQSNCKQTKVNIAKAKSSNPAMTSQEITTSIVQANPYGGNYC